MGRRKTIMLLITYRCNLRCSYCYEPKTRNYRMSVERARQLISEQMNLLGDNYDSVEIQFMGGEPLMEFSLMKEVSEWLWSSPSKGKDLMLFAPTNGTLLDDGMKSWFTLNREKISLGLSFDGNVDMQNRNRSASFDRVDLDYFARTWPDQSVKMTISPETIGSLADGVIFLHEKGFRYVSADLAMGSDILWTRESLKEYGAQLGRLSSYYVDHPDVIPFSMLRIDVASILEKRLSHVVKTCSCGEDMVCVDWTGDTYACHLFSPVALPVDKAVRSRKLYDFSDHSQFCSPVCSKCVLNVVCNHCYGMNYLCTDDVTKPSPFHCAAFKIMFVSNCRFRLASAERDGDIDAVKRINKTIQNLKIN